LLEKGKALLKKDGLLDEAKAELVERKLKPIHEQIEYFQNIRLEKFSDKIEETFKVYTDFVRESKKVLSYMEKNLY
jgi:hypothetical protein